MTTRGRPRPARHSRAALTAPASSMRTLLRTTAVRLVARLDQPDVLRLTELAAADALGGGPVTLDEVIGAHYEEPAQVVRGWWNGWS